MSFSNSPYLFAIIIGIVCFIILNMIVNRSYFKWIKTYWNYKQTKRNKISQLLYYIGFALILLSLLDLRGKEERVKAAIPDQKTIIILDSSTSMLAEDVKPNRFSKAIQIARHFVKNAPGHQVAIVLFSDVQKRLMPFTDDIDLIDSRLAALDKTNAVAGGSNIAQAIKEAVGYFQTENSDEVAMGNILVFTDAEESEGGENLSLGDNINLAVVGIGTAKGANIPLRWEDGSFRGFKTSKGENVTTKLDENYIKRLGKNVKNYHYWIANSYSLPTLEIKDFFKEKLKKNVNQGDISIRPVMSHYLLIPGIIIFCLSVLLGRFRTFHTNAIFLLLFSSLSISSLYAQETNEKGEKKEKEIPEAVKKDWDAFKAGKLSSEKVLKVAESFLRNNDTKRANFIYEEYAQDSTDEKVKFNEVTALLAAGDRQKAFSKASEFLKASKDEDLKNKMRSNLLIVNDSNDSSDSKDKNKENEKDQEDKENKDNKDNKENKDDQNKDKKDKEQQNQKNKPGKNGQDDKDSKDSKDSQGDNKDKQDKDSKPNDNKNDSKDKGKKGDEKDTKDPKDLKKPENQEPQTIEEKEKEIETKRKMVKTPAMVKQILNDDRELQKTLMDTSTNEKGKSREKRDW